jgi:hypothetical protein
MVQSCHRQINPGSLPWDGTQQTEDQEKTCMITSQSSREGVENADFNTVKIISTSQAFITAWHSEVGLFQFRLCLTGSIRAMLT